MARVIARFSLFAVISLLLSVCLLAPPAGSSAQTTKAQGKSETMTVTGCLQKGVETGGYYIVADNKMWELSSRNVKLDEHVGHQVTVTGTVLHRSQSGEAKVADSEKSEAAGKDYGDLSVRNLKMVSTSCSDH